MNSNRAYVKRIALCGLMTALMLVLSYIESNIIIAPGIPGVKLGLSNAVLLYAVYMLPFPVTLTLMAVKVLLSGLMFGGPTAMAFSFAGGLLSVTGMRLVRPALGVIAVSVVGAVLHNAGQVLVAMLMLRTANLMYYFALLSLVAVGTGMLTGVIAALVMKHLKSAEL